MSGIDYGSLYLSVLGSSPAQNTMNGTDEGQLVKLVALLDRTEDAVPVGVIAAALNIDAADLEPSLLLLQKLGSVEVIRSASQQLVAARLLAPDEHDQSPPHRRERAASA